MKQLVGSDLGAYTFSASGKTVSITGLTITLKLEQILLITNVTRGIVLFNFADATLGGTINGSNVITLTCSTSGMSDADRLQIYIDVDIPRDATIANLITVWNHYTVTVGTTTIQLIAANPNRKYLIIQNVSSNILYMKYNASAVSNQGIRLVASSAYEMSNTQGNLTTTLINGIASAASSIILLTEGS